MLPSECEGNSPHKPASFGPTLEILGLVRVGMQGQFKSTSEEMRGMSYVVGIGQLNEFYKNELTDHIFLQRGCN